MPHVLWQVIHSPHLSSRWVLHEFWEHNASHKYKQLYSAFHGHFWSFYTRKCSWEISVPTCLGPEGKTIYGSSDEYPSVWKINHIETSSCQESGKPRPRAVGSRTKDFTILDSSAGLPFSHFSLSFMWMLSWLIVPIFWNVWNFCLS